MRNVNAILWQMCGAIRLIFQCLTQHKISHFEDVLLSQSLGLLLKN